MKYTRKEIEKMYNNGYLTRKDLEEIAKGESSFTNEDTKEYYKQIAAEILEAMRAGK